MSLQLHRPDAAGRLEPRPPAVDRRGRPEDWRKALRSPRWRAAALRNPEMNPTSSVAAAAFWIVLAAVTFGLLLLGYGSHFWH